MLFYFYRKKRKIALNRKFLKKKHSIKLQMIKLMSQFCYSEDKIPFNSDNFYTLIKNQEKNILNSQENNEKLNVLIFIIIHLKTKIIKKKFLLFLEL